MKGFLCWEEEYCCVSAFNMADKKEDHLKHNTQINEN